MVKPEKWERIKELFGLALEREPNQRAGFLEEACGGDPTLRAEVESLLASYHATEGPAGGANSLPDPTGASASEAADIMAGRRIGPYQVIREIGHGGMATVHLAVRADDQYRQRVAIKLVRPGPSGEEILRRFLNERQTLAALDHSNIVKLLDGGRTEEGLPYLVMEYVDGMPIDEYCDSRRLTITERLQLFRIVCGAVQYAHQNLVIHRDLKPANILVTSDGIPKLLDFGIAKLLNPEFSAQTLLVTQTGVRLMTPEYASPEQIRGLPLTTATDIYSLGVMLYQLSSGRRPYRLKNQTPLEIERAICEEEPEKPSTAVTRVAGDAVETRLTPEDVSRTREGRPEKLRRRLQGDLDNIVLMALRKEPQRRYASAEQFSEDIRRHLENLPVVARKPTLAYRAAKFTRRHRAGVASAALVVLVLIGGVITTTWEARVARVEKARAERRFNDVRRLANSFLFEFHDAIQDLPGSTAARQLLAKRALEYLDSLVKEASDDQALQLELAMAYQRIGDIQGNPNNPNLGDSPGALESYRKALAIRETVAAVHPTNMQAQRELGASYERIGDILRRTKGPAAALESYQRNLAISEALLATDPRNARIRRNLSVIHNKLGYALESAGDLGGAQSHYHKALELAEALSAEDPTSVRARMDLAFSYDNFGDILTKRGDLEGALNSYEKKRVIFEELAAANPQSRGVRKGLLISDFNVGNAFAKLENMAGALQSYRKAIAIAEALAREDTENATAQDDLGISYASLGTTLAKVGKRSEALEYQRKALAIFETLAAGDPTNIHIRSELAQALIDTAMLVPGTGKTEEARRLTLRGLTMLKVQAERPEATIEELRASATALLTCEPADLRDPQAAVRYAERAAAVTKERDPTILDTLALAHFEAGDPERAVNIEEKALALLPVLTAGQPVSGFRRPLEAHLAQFRARTSTKGPLSVH